ncbi:Uncharacterised protein [[Clostridium] symbiosum]|nr:Uncharacterised protein [[Clostridium] symbiosum]
MADSLRTVMRKFIKYTKAVEITAQCGLISAAFVYKNRCAVSRMPAATTFSQSAQLMSRPV